MKKRLLTVVTVCTIAMASLSGCSGVIDLNGRSDELIAEYAAGVLMQYTYENLKPKPFNRAEYYPNGIPTADTITETVEDETKEGDLTMYNSAADYATMLGITCDMSYVGYEICDTFPNGGVETFYSISATKGNKLVVVHFNLTNNSGGDIGIDTLQSAKEYKLTVNGSTKVNVQDTILPEDIQNMSEVISPGASADRVLIFQVSQEVASDVKSMMLTVKDEAGSTISLNLKEQQPQ